MVINPPKNTPKGCPVHSAGITDGPGFFCDQCENNAEGIPWSSLDIYAWTLRSDSLAETDTRKVRKTHSGSVPSTLARRV